MEFNESVVSERKKIYESNLLMNKIISLGGKYYQHEDYIDHVYSGIKTNMHIRTFPNISEGYIILEKDQIDSSKWMTIFHALKQTVYMDQVFDKIDIIYVKKKWFNLFETKICMSLFTYPKRSLVNKFYIEIFTADNKKDQIHQVLNKLNIEHDHTTMNID